MATVKSTDESFDQLVKDNRTNFESTNPDKILNGDIDDFLEKSLHQNR